MIELLRRLDRRIPRLLPVSIVFVVLLVAGLSPQPVPELVENEDKLHHFLGFAALAFTARWAFRQTNVCWLAAACLLLALGIEYGQEFLPRREASAYDMLANVLGVLSGLLLARRLWR